VWLDPVLYGQIVGNVESALAAASPSDATTFAANAATFRAKVGSLDRAYRTGLAACARDVIVTSHAAFGYLSQRYGLRQEAISGLAPDAEPSPQHLADLVTLVERDSVTTICGVARVSEGRGDARAGPARRRRSWTRSRA
jgi:zinc transport system substrate-binding protein